LCSLKVRIDEVAAGENRLVKIRTAQIRTGEIGAREIGPRQDGLVKVHAAQVRIPQTCLREVRVAQIVVCQLPSGEVRMRQHRMDLRVILAPFVPRLSTLAEFGLLKLGLFPARIDFGRGVDDLAGERATVRFRRPRVHFDGSALDGQRVADIELVRKSLVELCHDAPPIMRVKRRHLAGCRSVESSPVRSRPAPVTRARVTDSPRPGLAAPVDATRPRVHRIVQDAGDRASAFAVSVPGNRRVMTIDKV
jgi:hypothetical protein